MILIKEQSQLSETQVGQLGLNNCVATLPPSDLGLSRGADGNIWSSYYIGLTSINGESLAVCPKVENVDFMSLFSYALIYQPSSEYFASCYDIQWEKETIANTQLFDVLTPLLVVQYFVILEKLVGRGLKRDYITIEDNLRGKIKGKLNFGKQFRQNVIKKREERFFCRYQEYSADIPVNRLLKKALDCSLFLLGDIRATSMNIQSSSFISSKLKIVDAFRNICSDVQLQSIKDSNFDKLNVYYPQAIQLAKLILRHYDNSVCDSKSERRVPPFWIDMSRLFEVYILGMLSSYYPEMIKFQVKGSYGTQCDYLHTGEGVVIDAKYKLWYGSKAGRESHYDYLVDDVREISGYARDEKLLSHFMPPCLEPTCIIIHPGPKQNFDFSYPLANQVLENRIEGYKGFYHISVPLPLKRI